MLKGARGEGESIRVEREEGGDLKSGGAGRRELRRGEKRSPLVLRRQLILKNSFRPDGAQSGWSEQT